MPHGLVQDDAAAVASRYPRASIRATPRCSRYSEMTQRFNTRGPALPEIIPAGSVLALVTWQQRLKETTSFN
jgi:hypothetical protein